MHRYECGMYRSASFVEWTQVSLVISLLVISTGLLKTYTLVHAPIRRVRMLFVDVIDGQVPAERLF